MSVHVENTREFATKELSVIVAVLRLLRKRLGESVWGISSWLFQLFISGTSRACPTRLVTCLESAPKSLRASFIMSVSLSSSLESWKTRAKSRVICLLKRNTWICLIPFPKKISTCLMKIRISLLPRWVLRQYMTSFAGLSLIH